MKGELEHEKRIRLSKANMELAEFIPQWSDFHYLTTSEMLDLLLKYITKIIELTDFKDKE